MEPLEAIRSNESTSSLVEIGAFEFCQHGRERCPECGVDYRESFVILWVMGLLCVVRGVELTKLTFSFFLVDTGEDNSFTGSSTFPHPPMNAS